MLKKFKWVLIATPFIAAVLTIIVYSIIIVLCPEKYNKADVFMAQTGLTFIIGMPLFGLGLYAITKLLEEK